MTRGHSIGGNLRQPLDQAVLRDDPRRRLRITLNAVLRSQGRIGLDVSRVRPQQLGELDEELLKAGRGNDLGAALLKGLLT